MTEQAKNSYTEHDYENLHRNIGILKRSAIDAYMRTNYSDFKIINDEYLYEPFNTIPNQYPTEYVTRPNNNGVGGGKWHDEGVSYADRYSDVDFSAEFDEVRSKVDKILEPWVDLPKLSNIDAEINECRKITESIFVPSLTQKGVTKGTSSILSLLNLIQSSLSSMSGSTITTYKNTFLLQLPRTIGGLHSISVLLGMALGAECMLFKETRRAVAEAVGKVKDSFDHVAGLKKGSKLSVALNIATQITYGTEKFSGGKHNSSFMLPSKMLDFTYDVESEADTGETEVENYHQCFEIFREIMRKINKEVKRAETAIKNNLIKNLNLIRQNKDEYDLRITPLTSNDVLNVNHDLAMEVAGTYLPSIAADLADASSKTINLSMSSVVYRDDRVGIGGVGPNAQFSEMVWLLYELLKDLSWDTRVSAANFKAAIEMIMNEDSSIRDRFNSTVAEMNKGSDTDPWN